MFTRGDLIHKLTAKSLIDDWQYGIQVESDKIENDLAKLELKQKIVRLSTKHSITSEYTSFVAIEDRDSNESSQTKAQKTVDQILAQDPEASQIDLLPYMEYELYKSSLYTSSDSVSNELKVGQNLEENLGQLFEKIDRDYHNLDESDRASYFK